MSHCAHWQLDQFLENVGGVLAPEGRIIASLRLAEGNAFGSPGSRDKQDSMHQEWQYPGVSWFKYSTVQEMAKKHGLVAAHIPEYTEFYTSEWSLERHDWLIFRRERSNPSSPGHRRLSIGEAARTGLIL